MLKLNSRITLLLFLTLTMPILVSGMKFNHPGGFSTQADLDFIKKKVNSNQQPWKKAYDQVVNSKYGKLGYKHKPYKEVICGNHNKPNIGCEQMVYDGMAAYTHALQWYIKGNRANANKAIAILDAWSKTWQRNKDFNDNLVASWATPWYVNAAEIIRYTGAGWSSKGINNFKDMCNKLLPYTTRGGMVNNGCMTQIEAQISIAMFLDNEKEFNKAVNKWRDRVPTYIYQKKDGAKPKLPPGRTHSIWGNDVFVDGLCMETCRDYGHSLLGYNSIIGAAQTAWTQGVDLFKEEKDRISDYMELHGSWTTGTKKVPKNICAGRVKCTGSKSSKPMPCGARAWDIAYRHFHDRLGMDLPVTKTMIERGRPAEFQRWNYKPETLIAAGIPFDTKNVPVTGIEITTSEVNLKIGKSLTLKANVKPENASNKNVSWSTSNDKIATVDKLGKVVAIATGKATISVKTKDGGYTDNCNVNVTTDVEEYPQIETVEAEQKPNIAANLLDGLKDDDHRWSVNEFPKSVVIDYGESKSIIGTKLYTYQGRSYHYKIEISELPNTDFIEVVNQSGATTSQPIEHKFDVTRGRYVKLTVTGATGYSNNWISINEFEIIEKTATPVDYTKYPSDDLYTQDGISHNTSELRVENDKRRRLTYMRFDLSGVEGELSNATLKLKETSSEAGNGTFKVYLGENANWNETNTSNLPAKAAEVGSYTGNIAKNQKFSIDLKGIPVGKSITLIVDMSTGGNDISFISSEGATPPQLQLTTLKSVTRPLNHSQKTGEIHIYPNPANEILNIELFGNNLNASWVQITDVSGRTLKTKELHNSQAQLNISGLRNGLYIIKLVDGPKQLNTKFIKN